jgi:hypothetical protein
MTDREAMKMALEALENLTTYAYRPSNIFRYYYPSATGNYVELLEFREKSTPAIEALRQALAQPEQEPPKREWVGLTEDEIKKVMQQWRNGYIDIKDVEQLLKDKNK